MKNCLVTVLVVMGIMVFSGCSQKKVATLDQTAPSSQTNQGDKGITSPQNIPTDSITSLERDNKDSVPAYIKELQAGLRDVYFVYDKYDLSEEAKNSIKTLADILRKNNKVKVSIEGHCDERGTNEYNLALGDRRAKVSKEYLAALGIPANRLDIISYGEEKPACTESNEKCWAKNRRDHFVLSEGKF